ncbi:MAG: hypothetical protein A2168_01975 [Planctomycetes bacterium RBG_13_50_24]|nr:MAG: hypothetical protein A2168_01975 [Planctomycetes bacterium RBG_13_50_24]
MKSLQAVEQPVKSELTDCQNLYVEYQHGRKMYTSITCFRFISLLLLMVSLQKKAAVLLL